MSHANLRTSYDALSRWYDWFAGSEELFVRQAIDGLALRPGERVLEVGCGTGKGLTDMAGRMGGSGFALGVDLSAGMLRRSSWRMRRSGSQSYRLCQADATALPAPYGLFDAVLMTFTLELFPPDEMTRVLAECRRVLRDGGRLGIAALLETDTPGWMERVYGIFHRRFPRLIDCRPIPVAQILPANGFKLMDEKRAWMWGLPVVVAAAVKEDHP